MRRTTYFFRKNCYSSDIKHHRYKNAFTLAEVLITLGIIGIVAAMTIPNMVANYRIKVLKTQFNKIYTDLNNASKLFEANENMGVYDYSYINDQWELPTKSFDKYIQYFTGSKYIAQRAGTNGYKLLGYEPKSINGNTITSTTHPCDEGGIASDNTGRIFEFDNRVSDLNVKIGPKVCVDINGQKGPNRYGYDWFVFAFTPAGNVIPYTGIYLHSNSDIELTDKTKYCNKNTDNAQYSCSYYALRDQSPEDSSKKYWGDFIK